MAQQVGRRHFGPHGRRNGEREEQSQQQNRKRQTKAGSKSKLVSLPYVYIYSMMGKSTFPKIICAFLTKDLFF